VPRPYPPLWNTPLPIPIRGVKNEGGHMDSFIPAHEQAIRLVFSLNMSNSLAFLTSHSIANASQSKGRFCNILTEPFGCLKNGRDERDVGPLIPIFNQGGQASDIAQVPPWAGLRRPAPVM
jgi:hypothetical protein